MKKIILLLNAVLIITLLLSLSSCKKVSSAIDNAVGNFTYISVSEDEAIIKKYTGKFTKIEIPETIDDKTVIGIDSNAFSNTPGIKEVVIPKTVKTLNEQAFADCYALQDVTIKSDEIYIKTHAFKNCVSLKTVKCDGEIAEIDDYAFVDCEKLEKVTSSDGIRAIGEYSFEGCSSLENITLNKKLSSVRKNSFENSNIKSKLYGNGFYIGTDDNPYLILYATMPLSETLSIHPNTHIIAEDTFSKNSSINTIKFQAKGLSADSKTAFIGFDNQLKLIITDTVGTDSLDFLHSYNFYSIVNRIQFNGFINSDFFERFKLHYYENITVLEFPHNISYIPAEKLSELTKLQNVIIPTSVKYVENYAFTYCTKLKKVFYGGTEAEYSNIAIGEHNSVLKRAQVYYYSDYDQHIPDLYWHYDENGLIKIWKS